MGKEEARKKRTLEINALCDEAGCSDKIRKIHFEQYVDLDRRWNPHPSKKFADWWKNHKDCVDHGIDVNRAFNCENYRQEFLEAKEIGIA